jgi:hypothetical protein
VRAWNWIILVLPLLSVISRAAEVPEQQKLIVSEWSVVLLSGEAMEDLPPFVPVEGKGDARGSSGVSLIQLRGPEGQELELTTAGLKDVVAWPVPERGGGGALQWRGTLAKTPKVEPRPLPESHAWSRLREHRLGMYFNVVGGASERFLFHRSSIQVESRVRAAVTSDVITLSNAGDEPSGPVVVILNDGLSRNGARVGSVRPNGEVTLSRAGMTEVSWDDRETLSAVQNQWRAAGLSEAEAKAAVDVWREELLHRPGFLLISRIPPKEYEKAFPLSVKPEPTERVRAGLLFDTLADQKERGDWLVNLDQSVAKWVKQYAEGDAKQRAAALKNLDAAAEFAEPFLRELAKDSDPAVAKAAEELLARNR